MRIQGDSKYYVKTLMGKRIILKRYLYGEPGNIVIQLKCVQEAIHQSEHNCCS